MKSPSTFIFLFIILGLLFCGVTIYFAMQPTSLVHRWAGDPPVVEPINGNMGYGAIGTSIISGVCFVLAARLIKK